MSNFDEYFYKFLLDYLQLIDLDFMKGWNSGWIEESIWRMKERKGWTVESNERMKTEINVWLKRRNEFIKRGMNSLNI